MDIVDFRFVHYQSCLDGCLNFVVTCLSIINEGSVCRNEFTSLKIGVWVAVSGRRIIGLIFFNGTVNTQRYRSLILERFLEQAHDDELQGGYFQQDGYSIYIYIYKQKKINRLERGNQVKHQNENFYTGMPAEEIRATVDTCFGLFGPHQHGVAKLKS